MKYLSLFSGVGGFELGIQRAYVDSIKGSENGGGKTYKTRNEDARLLTTEREGVTTTPRPASEYIRHIINEGQPTCVGFSEIDKYATKVYQHHFPKHLAYGDITKIDEKQLPDFDLLVGGFPCQSFSIAGKRGGFDDTRGTLFFEIARIAREKQPRLLLLENVKGLLSHDKGTTFYTIITTLDELGYDCQWQVLNAKDFGVPQNRERVFIVGHLRGTPRPEVFPLGETDQEDTQSRRFYKRNERRLSQSQERHEEIEHTRDSYNKTGRKGTLSQHEPHPINQLNQPTHSNDRVYGTDGVSPTLNTMQGGRRQPFITDPQGRKNKVCNPKPHASTLRANTHGNEQVVNGIRRLTPLECERLMSFPDNWTNVEGMSDTQRYKQCGNGVVSNVVEKIISKLI